MKIPPGQISLPLYFKGWYFSEELRFALANGYKLLSISQAYSFERGVNTFLELIQQLNHMKTEAQLNNQPTIRNIAKLLMNSMYGRFGMRSEAIENGFVNLNQLHQLAQKYNILNVIEIGSLFLVSYTLNETPEQLGQEKFIKLIYQFIRRSSNTNVAIAAAVTAYSRILINTYKLKALEQGLNIYYSDTDSITIGIN